MLFGSLTFGSTSALRGARAIRDLHDIGAIMLDRAPAEQAPPIERAAAFELGGWLPRALRRDRRKPAGPTGMHALVALQQADGHWELTPELAGILERERSEIERALQGASGDQSDCRRAWATALAIAWLELHAADAEDEWRLLRRKAQKWIEGTPATAPRGDTWTEAARQFLAE